MILFAQVFVGARLHVTGGALRGGRAVEGEGAVAGKSLIVNFITMNLIAISRKFYFDILSFYFILFYSCFVSIGHCCWSLVR